MEQVTERMVVWDRHERRVVGKPYSSLRRARSRADKLDTEYGASRYTTIPEGQVSTMPTGRAPSHFDTEHHKSGRCGPVCTHGDY